MSFYFPSLISQDFCRRVQHVPLDSNPRIAHAGTLPAAWGNPGAFARLGLLRLVGTQLSGILPASWAGNNSLPSLIVLELGLSNLTGTLPVEWGSPSAFQRLEALSIINCSISGTRLLRARCPDCQYLELKCNSHHSLHLLDILICC